MFAISFTVIGPGPVLGFAGNPSPQVCSFASLSWLSSPSPRASQGVRGSCQRGHGLRLAKQLIRWGGQVPNPAFPSLQLEKGSVHPLQHGPPLTHPLAFRNAVLAPQLFLFPGLSVRVDSSMRHTLSFCYSCKIFQGFKTFWNHFRLTKMLQKQYKEFPNTLHNTASPSINILHNQSIISQTRKWALIQYC